MMTHTSNASGQAFSPSALNPSSLNPSRRTVSRGDANLLLLAEILEASDAMHRAAGEPTYNGAIHEHDCGTPSCGLAHWYAYKGSTWLDADVEDVMDEFAVSQVECVELFGPRPCGGALTAAGAAAYIRGFVSNRNACSEDEVAAEKPLGFRYIC